MGSQRQCEVQRVVEEQRSYNQVRGGLPVCATCTANCGGNTVSGHTANTPSCPCFVLVDFRTQHMRTAAEINAAQAATEAAIFRGEF